MGYMPVMSALRFKRFKLLQTKHLRDRGTQYTGSWTRTEVVTKWGSAGETTTMED